MSKNKFDIEHLKRLLAQEQEIASLFYEFIRSVSPELAKFRNAGKKNIWSRNSSIEKKLEKELLRLAKMLNEITDSYTKTAWEQSNLKNDALVGEFIREIKNIPSALKEGLYIHNLEAYKAFKERATKGLNLSDRIWNLTTDNKTQIEIYLESGIAEGRSAAKISQDLRSLLKDPNKRFRRLRDPETGKLVLSKPMKDYHPGQGKYRSSFKNALRLTANETNSAYRLADHNRWKSLDFVRGIEVKLSGSHPEHDICDSLVGRYPKTYVFSGFHIGCICYAVPVLASQDEFVEVFRGGSIHNERMISSIPKKAQNYIADHSKQFSKWKSAPTFIEENFKYNSKKELYLPVH